MRIDLKAVAGGTFCALGIWLLLHAFGLAVGVVPIDGVGAASGAAWDAVSSAIALLGGAFIAGRASGSSRPVAGALHGVVLWGLCAALAGGLAVTDAAAALSVGGASGPWTLFAALFGGLAAAAVGGALGAAGAGRGPDVDRDAAIDEVWNELSQLRRELRQVGGHGASKVDRRRATTGTNHHSREIP